MPAGEKTGPQGKGPKTGRAAGYCAGYAHPGYIHPGFYGGFGRRMFGRSAFGRHGFRRWNRFQGHPGWMGYGAYPGAYPPPAPMTPEEEQEMLKNEEAWLKECLDEVRGQMNKEKE